VPPVLQGHKRVITREETY